MRLDPRSETPLDGEAGPVAIEAVIRATAVVEDQAGALGVGEESQLLGPDPSIREIEIEPRQSRQRVETLIEEGVVSPQHLHEVSAFIRNLFELFDDMAIDQNQRDQIEALIKEDIPQSLRFISGGTSKMKSLLDSLLKKKELI